MKLVLAVSLVILVLLWAGCSDDDSGPAGPGAQCTNVAGSWGLVLVDPDPEAWFPVITLFVDLAQDRSCGVEGEATGLARFAVSGQASTDSLHLRLEPLGPSSSPELELLCMLEREDSFHYYGEWKYGELEEWAALLGPAPDCSGIVQVTVGSGTTPVIDWEPDCPVEFLLVEQAGGSDVWAVEAEGAIHVEPPIIYGQTPDGLFVSEAEPLVPGQTYEVLLFGYVGDGMGINLGYAAFTP